MSGQVKTKSSKSTARIFIVFFLASVILGLLCMKIYTEVKGNELSMETQKLTKELNALKNEKIRLELALEKKTDLKEIERRAKEDLGLKKIEKYQIQYVSLVTEDKIETLKKNDDKVFDTVIRGFSIILEYLS